MRYAHAPIIGRCGHLPYTIMLVHEDTSKISTFMSSIIRASRDVKTSFTAFRTFSHSLRSWPSARVLTHSLHHIHGIDVDDYFDFGGETEIVFHTLPLAEPIEDLLD